MRDKSAELSGVPIGQQIRRLRRDRGWTLEKLARQAATSVPALHRYESGWDRFTVATLSKIASALGARLDVRLIPSPKTESVSRRPTRKQVVASISPLFWDRDIQELDLDAYRDWIVGRVLMFGNKEQVRAVRLWFGDAAILRAVGRRGVDERTRVYWQRMLKDSVRAP